LSPWTGQKIYTNLTDFILSVIPKTNDTPVGEEWLSQSGIKFRLSSKNVESADKNNDSCSDSYWHIGEGLGT